MIKVKFSPDFYKLYKKANVRVRNEVDRRIEIFQKNPLNSELNNHDLREDFEGLKSIDITNDYRAVYEEIDEGEVKTAYFHLLGTHKQLYETKELRISRG